MPGCAALGGQRPYGRIPNTVPVSASKWVEQRGTSGRVPAWQKPLQRFCGCPDAPCQVASPCPRPRVSSRVPTPPLDQDRSPALRSCAIAPKARSHPRRRHGGVLQGERKAPRHTRRTRALQRSRAAPVLPRSARGRRFCSGGPCTAPLAGDTKRRRMQEWPPGGHRGAAA